MSAQSGGLFAPMLARRTFLFSALGTAAAVLVAQTVPPHHMRVAAQKLLDPVPSIPDGDAPVFAAPDAWAARLIAGAEHQVGRTLVYDPSYVRLDYPGGDVPIERGVCTDVVVRAYRTAFGADLQKLVHQDMRRNFAAYPKIWGMDRPDRNIDHRRVPNLATFLRRRGARRPVSERAEDYRPGSIITQRLPGNRPHIAIVTHRASEDGQRPLVVHNIGAGARLEDSLFAFEITGHYRYRPG